MNHSGCPSERKNQNMRKIIHNYIHCGLLGWFLKSSSRPFRHSAEEISSFPVQPPSGCSPSTVWHRRWLLSAVSCAAEILFSGVLSIPASFLPPNLPPVYYSPGGNCAPGITNAPAGILLKLSVWTMLPVGLWQVCCSNGSFWKMIRLPVQFIRIRRIDV